MADIAWESTTVGYIQYVTDEHYQKFSDTVKRWYKPYRCSHCEELVALHSKIDELEKALGKVCAAIEREPVCGGDLDYPHGHNDWLGWRKKMMRPAAEAARSLLPKKEG